MEIIDDEENLQMTESYRNINISKKKKKQFFGCTA